MPSETTSMSKESHRLAMMMNVLNYVNLNLQTNARSIELIVKNTLKNMLISIVSAADTN
jgi:hypothetical protein